MPRKPKNSVLRELVEDGCDEDLLRSCAEYLAKKTNTAKRLSFPKLDDVPVLDEAADRLERFRREIFPFETYVSRSGFASVVDTIKALRFQAALANNFLHVLPNTMNRNLRGFYLIALSDHVRETTGKRNWKRVADLIQEFGGDLGEGALQMLLYNFKHSPAFSLLDELS